MKVSYNWLREFLTVDIRPEDLAKHLLLLGFEVAEMKRVGPEFSGVVVAEILEIQKHPNADRLSLCSVSVGAEKLSIVCGAKNIAVGQRVPLARVGARLPGGKSIERSKIRGVESQGMICSASELGLPEGNGGGILVLPTDAPLGKDAASLLGEADVVMEVEITSNRPDCLSHYGLARELGIYFRKPLKSLPTDAKAGSPLPPSAGEGQGEGRKGNAPISVSITAKDSCQRYIARYFEGVKVAPSPAWLSRRLELLGVRPINNLVDITNYVLLEYGHPLHVFDADRLEGGRIEVRNAKTGENILALDGREYALTPDDLVVADGKRPAAIAGVMGGEDSGVTGKTTRVVLEAAHFSAARVRRTSQRLRLRSDSSYRFERGLAAQPAGLASARAAELIRSLAAPAAESAPVDAYPDPQDAAPIPVTVERVERILGASHEPAKVEAVLRDLADRLTPANGGWNLFPPAHRLDLRGVQDVAEEVGRHLGYEAIGGEAAPVRLQRPKSLPAAELAAALRRKLASLGFCEACNYDFLSPQELERCGLDAAQALAVLNPLSDEWTYLRPSLVPGLLKSAAHNFRRGARSLRLFELGKAYHRAGKGAGEPAERLLLAGLVAGAASDRPDWTARVQVAEPNRSLYEAKGALAELLAGAAVSWAESAAGPLLHPRGALAARLPGGEAASVGLLHPAVAKAYDLPLGAAAFWLELDVLLAAPGPAPKLSPISPFPAVVRDLSVSLPETVRYADVEASLRGLPALRRIELVDRLRGKAAEEVGLPAGKASLTLRLTFGLLERTLRDDEVNAAIQTAVAALSKNCGAALRS